MTGLRSHQRHYFFNIFCKLVPVHCIGQQQYIKPGQRELQTEKPGMQGKSWVQYPPSSQLAVGKTRKGRSLLGVDHTHKLTRTFHSNCHVQLRSLKLIIKTDGRQQWIKRGTHEVLVWQTLPRGFSSCFLGLLLVRSPK